MRLKVTIDTVGRVTKQGGEGRGRGEGGDAVCEGNMKWLVSCEKTGPFR
jgi:hypothetical protein